MADLNVKLGPLSLKNPVMTASGTFGYGEEYEDFFPVEQLGAVVVKGIAPWASHGNPTPRVAEVTGGMLNAIGLQGPGIDAFRPAKVRSKVDLPQPFGPNIQTNSPVWSEKVKSD